ncbi:MAG: glycosyltransferase [Polyangiaceae bacterium]
MARIAVFGLGPMRWEQSTRLFALALRSWHFARTLARAGHEVLLFSIRGHAYEGWPSDKRSQVVRDGVSVWSISEHLCHERPEWIRRELARFRPDCVVGVNRDPAAVAVNFAGALPFWADINGDPMAEAQAKARTLGHDDDISEWHRKFLPVLRRADHFSTCSRAQRLALIGQLGMAGRLTAGNDGVELITAIPNSVDDEELELLGGIERPPRSAKDRFVVLSSGGFNTWIDPVVMFQAVDRAMAEHPAIHFVSTGGGIPGHHLDSYARFEELVAHSRFRERYELAGWVQTSELYGFYKEANVALLVDRFTYEGVLGARTRMLDWLAAELPIVCTRLSEISQELEACGAALASSPGSPQPLTNALLTLAASPRECLERGRAGRRYAETQLTAQVQLEPLLHWARNPARAPDGERRARLQDVPAPVHEVRKHVSLFREEARHHGLGGALKKTGEFAARKVRHGVQRAFDGIGANDGSLPGEAIETPRAEPVALPKRSLFDWRRQVAAMKAPPSVAVVLCVRGDEEADYVDWSLEQLLRQYYPHWRAVVVAPSTRSPALSARLGEIAERYRAHGRELLLLEGAADPLAHPVLARCSYVSLLAPGDLLRVDALAELVVAAEQGRADLVYGDEQEVDESNSPRPVQTKGDYSQATLLHGNFLGRGVLYRRAVLSLDETRLTTFPFQALSYDVALRAMPKVERALRVPVVLTTIHVPSLRPEAQRVLAEQECARLEEQVLTEAVWRGGWNAQVTRGPRPRTFNVRPRLDEATRVAVIVPDVSTDEALERCLRAAGASSPLRPEVVVTAARQANGSSIGRARWVVADGDAYGSLVQAALRTCTADYVVLVHPEIELPPLDWLTPLVEHAAMPAVGAVSPRVLAADGSVIWPGAEVLQPAAGHGPRPMAQPAPLAALFPRSLLEGRRLRRAETPDAFSRMVGRRAAKRGLTHLYLPSVTLYWQPQVGSGPQRDAGH